jgi:MFS family permease
MSRSLGSRFWTLWAAISTANLGDGISLTAFPLLAVSLTDDARLVALATVVRFLPFVLVGLPAGLVLDRHDRRRVAAVAQVGRAGALAGLAAVVLVDRATIGLLVGVAFVVGLGEVLTDGGLPALTRAVVRSDQLEVANARLFGSQTVTNLFLGPPLGALLFDLDPSLPFVAATATFLVAAIALVLLPGRYRADVMGETGRLTSRLTVGLRYVWGHAVLRPLALTVAVFAFVNAAGDSVRVLVATERLGLSGSGFGVLISLGAVASVITSFFVARIVGTIGHAGSLQLSIVVFSATEIVFGATTTVAVAVAAVLVSGVSEPTWNVVSSTIRQRLVPDEVFGRMMTAYLFIAWGTQPLGALVGGIVAEAWGPEWVFVLGGLVVGSLLLLARPMFRHVTAAMSAAPIPPRR